MPAVAEKQPRWLMICKCGATVKAAGTPRNECFGSPPPEPARVFPLIQSAIWLIFCAVAPYDSRLTLGSSNHANPAAFNRTGISGADSDDLARVYRFDLAQDSEMISPTIPI